VKYVAELKNVSEVALLGTADLSFWADKLEKEALSPVACDNRAQIVLSAVDSRYMGIAFRDFSVSISVRPQGDCAGEDAYFLAHAFNSSRLFAFTERAFFSTPYDHAAIQVNARLPVSFQVIDNQDVVLQAEMREDHTTGGRAPSQSGDHTFEGPVFLPGIGRGTHSSGKLFLAKIDGTAQTFPFDPARDLLVLKASPRHQILQWLIESRFTGKEWIVRESGTHAKSRTFNRT
jgi:hypothetical protein